MRALMFGAALFTMGAVVMIFTVGGFYDALEVLIMNHAVRKSVLQYISYMHAPLAIGFIAFVSGTVWFTVGVLKLEEASKLKASPEEMENRKASA